VYGYADDVSRILDIDEVVSSIGEGAIFHHVLGYTPQEYDVVVNPFRVDTRPGATFERSHVSGRLLLIDYGTTEKRYGVRVGMFDCVGAVQLKYQMELQSALNYIVDTVPPDPDYTAIPQHDKVPTIIQYRTRQFTLKDKRFWYDRYGITRNDLMADNCNPISSFAVLSRKTFGKPRIIRPDTSSYAIAVNDHVKIYSPHSKNLRFVSNCNANDVGGVGLGHGTVVITKAYKDHRVLRNAGVPSVYWFQNEGCVPDYMVTKLQPYSRVVFLYDNDRQGMFASHNLRDISLHPNAEALWVPEGNSSIKDPADLRWLRGERDLREFLTQNKLI